MIYQYITIQAIPAPLDEVLDETSDYSKGLARERELAESAPYLAKRVKHLEWMLESMRQTDGEV